MTDPTLPYVIEARTGTRFGMVSIPKGTWRMNRYPDVAAHGGNVRAAFLAALDPDQIDAFEAAELASIA